GERNTTRIRHPLSQAVPLLGRWLDVPPRQLPGDEDMPRVQGRSHGASGRLVVSPGHEEAGIFHMPVGQSGHPLSPYYQKGHPAWEEGQPTPVLPGRAVHRLVLRPTSYLFLRAPPPALTPSPLSRPPHPPPRERGSRLGRSCCSSLLSLLSFMSLLAVLPLLPVGGLGGDGRRGPG